MFKKNIVFMKKTVPNMYLIKCIDLTYTLSPYDTMCYPDTRTKIDASIIKVRERTPPSNGRGG